MDETNFDHYLKEIVAHCLTETVDCDFIRDKVLRMDNCSNFTCNECKENVVKWFDELYQEPKVEIDWENVPVDTIVYVSNSLNSNGMLKNKMVRCFKEKEENFFVCIADGYDSNDIRKSTKWKYCELAHPADIEKYKK